MPNNGVLRENTRMGQPDGADDFISRLEDQAERTLLKGNPEK
jgi:hypothetical protein